MSRCGKGTPKQLLGQMKKEGLLDMGSRARVYETTTAWKAAARGSTAWGPTAWGPTAVGPPTFDLRDRILAVGGYRVGALSVWTYSVGAYILDLKDKIHCRNSSSVRICIYVNIYLYIYIYIYFAPL